MPIKVKCTCGAVFSIPESMAGKKGKCKKCNKIISIPGAEPEKAPAASPKRPRKRPAKRKPRARVAPKRKITAPKRKGKRKRFPRKRKLSRSEENGQEPDRPARKKKTRVFILFGVAAVLLIVVAIVIFTGFPRTTDGEKSSPDTVTEKTAADNTTEGKEPAPEVKHFEVQLGRPEDKFTVNTYVVVNPETKEAILIDPGGQDMKLDAFILTGGLQIKSILITHGHGDHINAVRYYSTLHKAPIRASCRDKTMFEKVDSRIRPDYFTDKCESITAAGFKVKVFHTPGHSPGSVCYGIGDCLFSGATLFKEAIGRTWGKDQEEMDRKAQQIISGIREKLLVMPDETKVFPGHMKPTTLGHEKKNNLFLTQ
ncbi:MAG: MBL fold metallo-hydrolase [Planctomycetota bacterium]|nr:MAG: MBL fold metallo-hydrolase [Planctomycetota bacterium]